MPPKTSKTLKKVTIANDAKNDSDNETDVKYKNNYDSTAQNVGDEDDILADGDLDAEVDIDEYDDNEDVDEGDADVDIDNDNDNEEGDGGDDCEYDVSRRTNGVKKISANIDKFDDDNDDDYMAENLDGRIYVDRDERIVQTNITKYERVRILGDRTAQLAQGAKPMIRGVSDMDPFKVAQLEFESKQMPINIVRTMPDGTKELWELSELNIPQEYIKYGFTGGDVDRESIKKIDNAYKKGGSITGYSHLLNMPPHIEKTISTVEKKSNSRKKKN